MTKPDRKVNRSSIHRTQKTEALFWLMFFFCRQHKTRNSNNVQVSIKWISEKQNKRLQNYPVIAFGSLERWDKSRKIHRKHPNRTGTTRTNIHPLFRGRRNETKRNREKKTAKMGAQKRQIIPAAGRSTRKPINKNNPENTPLIPCSLAHSFTFAD